jgi:predicted metal-dependent phosphoesterase TrpH
VLTPVQIAARARQHDVDLWALTDHDEVAGLAQAGATAAVLGVQFVPGVEISVSWCGQTVHILGLAIDPTDPALTQGLAEIREGRTTRAQEMGKRLDALGMPGSYEGALPFAGNPALIARTHFARYLVAQGYCSSMQEVFDTYLGDGKPGHVPVRWASLDEAVGWIVGAGGRAVIAHPGRYKYTSTQRDAFLSQFKDLGGVGIEVVTGSHTPDQYDEYAQVARRYGFLASSGSDFHGPNESRIDLGQVPALPAGLTPVWHDWI